MIKSFAQLAWRRPRVSLVAAALSLATLTVCLTFRTTAASFDNCATIASEIKSLEAERTSLQKDLQKAAGSEKQGLVAQIKRVNGEIQQKQAQLDQCQNKTDLLNKCSPGPDGYYKLPFGSEQGWVLAGGNWKNFPSGWDSGIDAALPSTFGRAILFKGDNALTVEEKTHKAIASPVLISAVVGNWPASWSKVDATLVWSHDGYTGVGNYLIVKHDDGTYAVYWHLQRRGVRVHVGDHVERGDWVAVSDNTGTSTTPHCHFDVRTGWDKAYPANMHEYPSIRIRLQDNDHNCWIPKVGDALVSNN